MNQQRTDLLNIWKQNTGGKVPVLRVKAEPSLVQMLGYQPAKVKRIFTYGKG